MNVIGCVPCHGNFVVNVNRVLAESTLRLKSVTGIKQQTVLMLTVLIMFLLQVRLFAVLMLKGPDFRISQTWMQVLRQTKKLLDNNVHVTVY